jgi:ATP:ADP antiporter, AAA family
VIEGSIGKVTSVVIALYVWTGLVATLVVPSFWTMIDRSLRLADAKRVFAVIGAGGTLGAMTGSAIAAGLGRLMSAQHLVTVGAVAFALVTMVSIRLAPGAIEEPPVGERREVGARRSRRYVRWMVGLVLISTITLTLADLTFKQVIAERLHPDDLASVLGAIYTGLNVLSLVIQLVLTPRLLARFGVAGALVILPLTLVATASGFALTGTVIAIVAMKLGDGGLRHSLNRVATEILYVPIPGDLRDGAKPIADALGQRGGQALAALLVFALAAAGDGSPALAWATAVTALGWLVAIAVMRTKYVRQFSDTLRAGEIARQRRIPELDATSMELLVESLSSPDEPEALAALELLVQRGGRVPALVLYHPARHVVRRALALLVVEGRRDLVPVLGYLVAHADPQIRAAALAAANNAGHHEQVVEALGDRDPAVRAAAMVAVAGDPDHAASAEAGIAELVAGTPETRIALARAIGFMPAARFVPILDELLSRREPAVMREVLELFARSPDLAEPSRLLQLLQDPHVRSDVRRVFVAAGDRGLDALIAALDDPRTPQLVQRHVPRTISRFRAHRALAALVARLGREPDGATEFKILRALGRMRSDDPRGPIDTAALRDYARRAVADAARYATLVDRLDEERPPVAPGAVLLRELLVEKRRYAIEHVFRALDILQPRAGLRSVHAAIASSDGDRRAAAREVFEQLVRSEIRIPMLAVIDDLSHEERRQRLGALAIGPHMTYDGLIGSLLEDPSASLRCVAAYHVAERQLGMLRPDLVRLRTIAAPPLVVHAFEQALARLDA